MKKIFFVTTLAVLGLAVLPTQSMALSCIDAAGMIENFTTESDYQIVLATPTEQTEFVKADVDESDPNMMYPEGYTAQLLSISEAYKGSVPDTEWVYFERNGTWNYLCVNEPPKVDTEQVYVLHRDSGLLAVTKVVAVYESDSKTAKDLLAVLAAEESDEEPVVYETTKDYWLQQLYDELKEIAFYAKLKLAEWNFWRAI